ncbi:PXA domain-containing protein [Ditylenchus destructor]|uniref:PXA domain-containing protein n=1 Tax=Ditylenchus destructor TaxID=166010 RepID=A0AAD4RDQ3_9BILA|nr:PXA domain-containing protein [Ditylenchus destructor]
MNWRLLTTAAAAFVGVPILVLGIEWTLVVTTCFLAFFVGFFICIAKHSFKSRDSFLQELSGPTEAFKFSEGLPFLLTGGARFKQLADTYAADRHSMTGSEQLDSILEQILHFVMRDYVDSWYKNMTPDTLLQESLKRTARRTVAAFSHCLKKVNWVPMLTRDFMDDFASHLRLYRKAKEKVQIQRDNLLKVDDLESVFFDYELEMEKSYCRDLVSTSAQYESAYLHDIGDILLYLLMPPEDFRSRPLRFLLREVLITKIFIPIMDKLSDPTYLNYLCVWLLSELPINTEDFVTSIETCPSVQELEALIESVHEEINSLRSKDTGGEHAETFKQQIASLEFTQTLIKQRMVMLANQPELVITKQVGVNLQLCC